VLNLDSLICAELIYDGSDEVRIPSGFEGPASHQMVGTPHEKLSEVACRCCYDSCGVDPLTGKNKGRSSEQLHTHILDVKNYNVYEHADFTVLIERVSHETLLDCFINRPGVWCERTSAGFEVTLNHRCVLEWDTWETSFAKDHGFILRCLGSQLREQARKLAPQIYPESKYPIHNDCGLILKTENLLPTQASISLYLSFSRGACFDSETEVLTSDGWKNWKDVDGSEFFATLNMKTEELEFQKSTQIIREPYYGKMYHVQTECVDLKVTPNHRMVVRKVDTQAARRKEEGLSIIQADALLGKRVKYKRTAKWVGELPEYFDIPNTESYSRGNNKDGGINILVCNGVRVDSMAFAKFIGYWLAEGGLTHTTESGYMVTLSQKWDGKAWEGILEVLDELPFKYSVNVRDIESIGDNKGCENQVTFKISGGKALYDFLKPYDGVENKRVPKELKNWGIEYQQEMILAYLEGDGCLSFRATLGEGPTVSKRLADDLQEAALKAGWSASIRMRDPKWKKKPHHKDIYIVGFAERRNSEPVVNTNGMVQDKMVEYSGVVYCATVPNGTLYVRRNGKPCWSGNSQEQCRHRFRMSQRSTRFVDESESSYVRHPLITQFLSDDTVNGLRKQDVLTYMKESESSDKTTYNFLVGYLQDYLKTHGVDGTQARKQARGAARGFLGMALHTEMIFTTTVKGWRWILSQRATKLADAEIRVLYATGDKSVLSCLKSSRYGHFFDDLKIEDCPDGIGKSLV
jgi:thymidylate synthase ThyX